VAVEQNGFFASWAISPRTSSISIAHGVDRTDHGSGAPARAAASRLDRRRVGTCSTVSSSGRRRAAVGDREADRQAGAGRDDHGGEQEPGPRRRRSPADGAAAGGA
jgi:hypothetical protein